MGQAPANPSMDPLLDAILEHVPPPPGSPDGPFSMLVTMTERDSFLGRVATGRIASGRVKVGDKIKILRHNGKAVSTCMTIYVPPIYLPKEAFQQSHLLYALYCGSVITAYFRRPERLCC